MVGGVIAGVRGYRLATAANDAAGAPVPRTGCGNGVLAVVAARLHGQPPFAYAKDGSFLPPAYGAPARVHSPVKLGYKNTKYLTRIVFMAARNGGYWSDEGYEWYGGT